MTTPDRSVFEATEMLTSAPKKRRTGLAITSFSMSAFTILGIGAGFLLGLIFLAASTGDLSGLGWILYGVVMIAGPVFFLVQVVALILGTIALFISTGKLRTISVISMVFSVAYIVAFIIFAKWSG